MSVLINNIRFGVRYLKRQRINTSLHILGLTLGTSVCPVIAFFLRYELRFDAYHKYAKQTYRVNTSWTEGLWTEGKYEVPISSSPFVMAEALRQDVSGLRKVVRAETINKGLIEIGTQNPFVQSQILITEPEFLDVFNVMVVSGDARKALSDPFKAILTQSAARKFFGTENALGKTFKFKNEFLITPKRYY
jgi:putative ABC transport system permease protein